jgi:hypothetical protein
MRDRNQGRKFRYLNVLPSLLPVPGFDRHVIATSKYDARCWMHSQATNVVRVCFKRSDFLVSVIIEDAQLEVVRSSNKPVFPSDEFNTPYWDLCDFKCFDNGTSVMIVDINGTIVETCD